MIKKRFVIGDDNIAMFEVIDMEKEELVCECRAIDVETLVNLLNSLVEENEMLKKQTEDYDMNLLKEFILFYKKFDGYENSDELRESELDLIDLFLGERYEY